MIDEKLFFAKTKLATETRHGMTVPCLEWKAASNKTGYGMVASGGSMKLAHRVAWNLVNGPILDGLCVLHRCDNRACVNVEHLFLGTQAANMADMNTKGRRARGDRSGPRLHPECVPRGESHWKAKLTAGNVRFIHDLRGSGWTQMQLSVEFGISRRHIGAILNGKNWAHAKESVT